MSTIPKSRPIVTLPVQGDDDPTPPPAAAGSRKRYGQSPQGRMLQEHREAAGLSREELALRLAAARTNRASWLLSNPKATLEWEAAQEVDRIRRIERATKPAGEEVYEELHDLIDMLPPDATVSEIAVAHERRRQRAKDARRDELRARGTTLARLVWGAADDPDFLDQALASELRSADLSKVELGFVARAALYDLADQLRVLFPQRPEMDAA